MVAGRLRFEIVLVFAVIAPLVFWLMLSMAELVPALGEAPYQLSDRLSSLQVEGEGQAMRVVFGEGAQARYLPEEFLADLRDRVSENHGWRRLFVLLDITSWTSLLWVFFGLLGQSLFLARMLVQWVASERAKSSVVPPAFWWLSLVGSTMLMIYFIWRVEIIGFIGQSTGWFVYLRNLYFIYRVSP